MTRHDNAPRPAGHQGESVQPNREGGRVGSDRDAGRHGARAAHANQRWRGEAQPGYDESSANWDAGRGDAEHRDERAGQTGSSDHASGDPLRRER